MRINRRTVTVGLATLALVGLTGGGIAWAGTDEGTPWSSGSAASLCAGGHGMAYGDHESMTAAADYLGLTVNELVDEMHSGKALADIARAQGKSVSGLRSAMVDAMKRDLGAGRGPGGMMDGWRDGESDGHGMMGGWRDNDGGFGNGMMGSR